jgi:hypothetical protein
MQRYPTVTNTHFLATQLHESWSPPAEAQQEQRSYLFGGAWQKSHPGTSTKLLFTTPLTVTA